MHMEIILFKLFIGLSLAIFLLPKKSLFYFSLFIQSVLIVITSYWATSIFLLDKKITHPFISLLGHNVNVNIDSLSAFFILVINFTVLTGLIYAKGYLVPYIKTKNKIDLAWHYFNFIWLHISMLLVVMLHDALAFLIIWEIMSLSSFFLVIFDHEKKATLKIGVNYLIQMHIGVVLLMVGFIWVNVQTGGDFSFDWLGVYFATHPPLYLFMLFFLGFGIKAGFIPLHTWLPQAHPAAPSHVSGVMSGVMIKMGIYGILRVLMYIHHDLFDIGFLVLFISLLSGIIGVSMAIVQHDIKKLLAYHSIENIGIIGIGIGLGIIGLAENIPFLSVLGFGGGILHILNHSLFKSLLFYTAGSVYKQTHTRNIEQLGGLIKKMPKTALFFLLGALAISGLPPFNGFISEFLIYFGMFKSLHLGNLNTNFIILFTFSGLAIIGGLAVFCFTKVFSITFLGTPRSNKAKKAVEVDFVMLLPAFMIGTMILLIGFFSGIFMSPLAQIVHLFTGNTFPFKHLVPVMNHISLSSGILIVFAGIFMILRIWQQKQHKLSEKSTWGCAYTGANPATHQYTATSFADNFIQLSAQLVQVKRGFKHFEEEEIFPEERSFKTHSLDVFENILFRLPLHKMIRMFRKIAIFQTGKIQHYLLYALIFLIIISVLTYLNWI